MSRTILIQAVLLLLF